MKIIQRSNCLELQPISCYFYYYCHPERGEESPAKHIMSHSGDPSLQVSLDDKVGLLSEDTSGSFVQTPPNIKQQ
ncbi:protein of unknown function [Legionella fallonii LLAP-10]|uniref:Uncharacterized protein n=1 Tax=Legionella fallonii LLAP-10 TaxID=1212491 RepID=A0A098G211_9GAMM|nr:protein of unknown function [Legionella fallonii LLAP-10]